MARFGICLFLFLQLIPPLITLGIPGKASLTYALGVKAVRTLEKIPSITDDPVHEIISFISNVLLFPISLIFKGSTKDTLRPVDGPVRVIRPPISDAIWYWRYAKTTSCTFPDDKWDCPECKLLGPHIQLVKIVRNLVENSFCFITVDHDRRTVVYACRGGTNLGAGLSILQAVLRPIPGVPDHILVHTGIYNAVVRDYDVVVSTLDPIIHAHPDYKVVFVGWSYGGMQVTIMLFLIKYRNLFPNTAFELYTYGALRSGNRGFANYINNLTIPVARVVNEDDIYFASPAALGYYSHHNELFLRDDGRGNTTARYCSTEVYEDPNCGQSRPFLKIYLELYADHFTYFGIHGVDCGLEDPLDYIMNLIIPILPYLPTEIRKRLPRLPLYTDLFLRWKEFINYGLKDLYRVASNSSLYS